MRIFDTIKFLLFTHVMKQKGFLPLIANMLFVSKNCLLEKVAFVNSSCFMICELNWIVFMLFKEKVLQETLSTW